MHKALTTPWSPPFLSHNYLTHTESFLFSYPLFSLQWHSWNNSLPSSSPRLDSPDSLTTIPPSSFNHLVKSPKNDPPTTTPSHNGQSRSRNPSHCVSFEMHVLASHGHSHRHHLQTPRREVARPWAQRVSSPRPSRHHHHWRQGPRGSMGAVSEWIRPCQYASSGLREIAVLAVSVVSSIHFVGAFGGEPG